MQWDTTVDLACALATSSIALRCGAAAAARAGSQDALRSALLAEQTLRRRFATGTGRALDLALPVRALRALAETDARSFAEALARDSPRSPARLIAGLWAEAVPWPPALTRPVVSGVRSETGKSAPSPMRRSQAGAVWRGVATVAGQRRSRATEPGLSREWLDGEGRAAADVAARAGDAGLMPRWLGLDPHEETSRLVGEWLSQLATQSVSEAGRDAALALVLLREGGHGALPVAKPAGSPAAWLGLLFGVVGTASDTVPKPVASLEAAHEALATTPGGIWCLHPCSPAVVVVEMAGAAAAMGLLWRVDAARSPLRRFASEVSLTGPPLTTKSAALAPLALAGRDAAREVLRVAWAEEEEEEVEEGGRTSERDEGGAGADGTASPRELWVESAARAGAEVGLAVANAGFAQARTIAIEAALRLALAACLAGAEPGPGKRAQAAAAAAWQFAGAQPAGFLPARLHACIAAAVLASGVPWTDLIAE